MLRDWDNPLPHGAGLLWQQFLVDAYCMLEANRLAYLQRYQDDLRVEKYNALCATVQEREQDGDEHARTSVGRRVVLPASYAGSPRALQQNYYDAMSMVREFGKPDLFITITANPAWLEVIMLEIASLIYKFTLCDSPTFIGKLQHFTYNIVIRLVIEICCERDG